MKKETAIKEHILRILEKRKGEPVSGPQLAASLSVSRAAIWKAVEELRGEGYQIAAATNRGYSLSESSDLLSVQGIAASLRHRELEPLIHVYDTLESTNITAKQLASSGAPHGTLVAAAAQTAGRGRLGRSFFSPRDAGVYFSILLRPEPLARMNPVLFTTAASVAAARAVEELTGKDVQIKWVNDLYLEEKKICGILSEGVTNFETGLIESIVVGIGINCFVPSGGFPENLSSRTAALFSARPETAEGGDLAAADRHFSKNALIAASADHMLDILSEVSDGRFIEEYKRRSLVLGREICFFSSCAPVSAAGEETGDASACSWPPAGAETGVAVDIDSQGGLIVELPGGGRRTLSTGEISVRLHPVK